MGAFSSESSFSFLFSLFLRESSRSYLGDIPIFHPFSPPFDMLSNRVRQLASVSFFPRKNMERKNMRRENYSLVSSILSLSFLSNASKSSQLLKRIHVVGSISCLIFSFLSFPKSSIETYSFRIIIEYACSAEREDPCVVDSNRDTIVHERHR